jgi:superoxide dismutase, Fe-Mn family
LSGAINGPNPTLPDPDEPDNGDPIMPFTLPPLPYTLDALAPHMSAETLAYHHGKHHQAYVDKTNQLMADAGLQGRSLVDVIRSTESDPLRNNAGQLWNHSFFWQCLSPEPISPAEPLMRMIMRDFGSLEALHKHLAAAAIGHFGSGWAWLVLDDGALRITSLHDGDTPMAHGGMAPLLTLDLWEHAYYIDYRNARPQYIEALLSALINWEFVARNLDGNGSLRANQD